MLFFWFRYECYNTFARKVHSANFSKLNLHHRGDSYHGCVVHLAHLTMTAICYEKLFFWSKNLGKADYQ